MHVAGLDPELHNAIDVKLVGALLLALCLVAVSAWGVVQLVPGEPTAHVLGRSSAVRSIRFLGDPEPPTIDDALRTRLGAPLSERALELDRATIVRALLDDSRLDAAVDARVEVGVGGVDVIFTIHEGPAFQIGRVSLGGNMAARFPDLAEQITVRPGDDVSERAIERSQERLAWWLVAHGVPRVDIRHEVVIDHAAARADVTFSVTSATASARRD
jgi:outer membrane protein assembly factor BamA